MTHHTRLKRLEAVACRRTQRTKSAESLSEEQWLMRFETWGRAGYCADEPDFPVAVAFYRKAIEDARTQAEPPRDPEADFRPAQTDPLHPGPLNWQHASAKVREGWIWLAEMLL